MTQDLSRLRSPSISRSWAPAPPAACIARELSQAGFSVVVLEQGPRLTLADFEHDELKYWFNAGLTNDVVKNPQTFRDDRSKRGERNLVRPSLYYARTVGGSSTHYTANYWRFHEVDFDERSRARIDRRHRLRRLADPLRGAGAVLHEGRVGDRRLRAGGREPVRSAAQQAVSDAAAAGEVLGRAARARRAQARSASVPRAAGDQLAALSRPARVRSLRLLPRLRLRSAARKRRR